jgi:hypothetical protein
MAGTTVLLHVLKMYEDAQVTMDTPGELGFKFRLSSITLQHSITFFSDGITDGIILSQRMLQ